MLLGGFILISWLHYLIYRITKSAFTIKHTNVNSMEIVELLQVKNERYHTENRAQNNTFVSNHSTMKWKSCVERIRGPRHETFFSAFVAFTGIYHFLVQRQRYCVPIAHTIIKYVLAKYVWKYKNIGYNLGCCCVFCTNYSHTEHHIWNPPPPFTEQ